MTLTQQQPKTTGAKRLAGKVAVVTGGSRGIGAGIALRLAEEGATVAVNYNNSKDAADKIVKQIEELGSKAAAFKGNVSSEQDSKNLFAEVTKEFGSIDILVNNAGVYDTRFIKDVTEEHVDYVIDTNIKGVIYATKEALKNFADGGRIINISSKAAQSAMPGFSVYSATKAALDTLTRTWAQELGKRKITVNGVAPGPVASDMFNTVPQELKDEFINKTALGRIGEPEDIAAIVAFLASEDGRWVTGHTIAADGGITV